MSEKESTSVVRITSPVGDGTQTELQIVTPWKMTRPEGQPSTIAELMYGYSVFDGNGMLVASSLPFNTAATIVHSVNLVHHGSPVNDED